MPRDLRRYQAFPRCGLRRAGFALLATAVSAAGVVGLARAIDDMTIAADSASGTGWSLRNLRGQLELGDDGLAARVTIGELKLLEPARIARDLVVDCGVLELEGSRVACRQARIGGDLPEIGRQDLAGTIVYDRASGDVDLALTGLAVAGGQVDINGSLHASAWQIEASVAKADTVELAHALSRMGTEVAGFAATAGSLDGEFTARGSADGLEEIEFALSATGLSVGNEAGTVATDGLGLSVQGRLQPATHGWRFEIATEAPQGQAYFEPVFVDLGAGAMRFDVAGTYAESSLIVDRFELDHANSVSARGSARLRSDETWTVELLEATAERIELPGAWNTYVAPFLLNTAFANLETAGQLSGGLSVVDGAPTALDLRVDEVTVDDGRGTLAFAGLAGELHWTAPESQTDVDAEETETLGPIPSTIGWQGGSLFGMEVGPARVDFTASGRGVRLIEETRIPLLDGAVRLEALRIRNLGEENMAFLIGAEVEPISVAQIGRALGWPEFGGTLAGSIRRLRMRDGVVSLGTTLVARVFDGEVQLSDLRLERPFGDWPRLFASIELENLDLDQVTSAFAFGRITGRLGGYIRDLELFNWMPVAFDAKLATPPDDRSRHRISQRAVENIGSLGGSSASVTAALSSGFLRFFEDFNYDRLGITCRLRNEVCLMGGIAPAEGGGYYLVKGKGVPRINVIGNRKRVDWPRLVRQLIAITEAEAPVVQ